MCVRLVGPIDTDLDRVGHPPELVGVPIVHRRVKDRALAYRVASVPICEVKSTDNLVTGHFVVLGG